LTIVWVRIVWVSVCVCVCVCVSLTDPHHFDPQHLPFSPQLAYLRHFCFLLPYMSAASVSYNTMSYEIPFHDPADTRRGDYPARLCARFSLLVASGTAAQALPRRPFSALKNRSTSQSAATRSTSLYTPFLLHGAYAG